MIRSHPLSRLCFAALLAVLALAITSCGDEPATTDESGEAATEASSQTSTEQRGKNSRAETGSETATAQSEENSAEANEDALPEECERPSPKVVAAIEEGLTVGGGGSLGKAYAVRSDDFDKVWMVAAEIEGEGLDGVIGVWATNDIHRWASYYAADSVARDFSDWGSGPVGQTDHGIDEAKACLG